MMKTEESVQSAEKLVDLENIQVAVDGPDMFELTKSQMEPSAQKPQQPQPSSRKK